MANERIANIQTFREAIKISFITAYFDLIARIENLREFKKKREEHLLHVEALIAVVEEAQEPSAFPSETAKQAEAVLDQKIEAKKLELAKLKSGVLA